jgi:dipeptide/tripeptide permease
MVIWRSLSRSAGRVMQWSFAFGVIQWSFGFAVIQWSFGFAVIQWSFGFAVIQWSFGLRPSFNCHLASPSFVVIMKLNY